MYFIDPRVNDWSMMSSPFPTMALCVFYAYFSKSLGPRLMANRKPLDLRKILVYYNLFQTIFSTWIFYEVYNKDNYDLYVNKAKYDFCFQYLMSGWWGHYSFKCQPVDYSRSPMAMRVCIPKILLFRMKLKRDFLF